MIYDIRMKGERDRGTRGKKEIRWWWWGGGGLTDRQMGI